MENFLEPSLFTKYNKSKQFVKSKKNEKQTEDGPSLAEELELMRKLSLENQRYLMGAEKIFTDDDFIYNYDEHYPDMGDDQHEPKYKNVLVRMTGDYDVPKFMRSKKPKGKKKSEEDILRKESEDKVANTVVHLAVVPTEVILVKKVKGKNKKHR